MTDRALELVVALAINPWMPPAVKETAEKLLTKWEGEDLEVAEKQSKFQPDLVAKLRNPSVQSYSDNKKNMREAADEITALRLMRDDLNQRLSTALEQLGTVSARLGAAQQALRCCLAQMGYANLTDAELVWELKQGNQHIPAIQRARAVLTNDAKIAETLKPDTPNRPRCKTCTHWDNSALVGGSEKTGMCRGALPEIDRSTGAAVWPFSQATDSCPSHAQQPSDCPY